MIVIGVDSTNTEAFTTSVIMLSPGQTIDVLVTTDQPVGRYYIVVRAYAPAQGNTFDNTTTVVILKYNYNGIAPRRWVQFPCLTAYNNLITVTTFNTGHQSPAAKIPSAVDSNLYFTIGLYLLGLYLFKCSPCQQCGGENNTHFAAKDSAYTKPFIISVITLDPGKTIDVLVTSIEAASVHRHLIQ